MLNKKQIYSLSLWESTTLLATMSPTLRCQTSLDSLSQEKFNAPYDVHFCLIWFSTILDCQKLFSLLPLQTMYNQYQIWHKSYSDQPGQRFSNECWYSKWFATNLMVNPSNRKWGCISATTLDTDTKFGRPLQDDALRLCNFMTAPFTRHKLQ